MQSLWIYRTNSRTIIDKRGVMILIQLGTIDNSSGVHVAVIFRPAWKLVRSSQFHHGRLTVTTVVTAVACVVASLELIYVVAATRESRRRRRVSRTTRLY